MMMTRCEAGGVEWWPAPLSHRLPDLRTLPQHTPLPHSQSTLLHIPFFRSLFHLLHLIFLSRLSRSFSLTCYRFLHLLIPYTPNLLHLTLFVPPVRKCLSVSYTSSSPHPLQRLLLPQLPLTCSSSQIPRSVHVTPAKVWQAEQLCFSQLVSSRPFTCRRMQF